MTTAPASRSAVVVTATAAGRRAPTLCSTSRALRDINIDTKGGTVQVGPGVRLYDFYNALDAHNVAVPAGTCPTVGITGLTLGGGHGLVARAFGLTCDSLLAVDIVTADGNVHHCTAKENSDLFWALRGGGGGSFGVVTSLTYALHDAPPDVTTFSVEWAWAEAANGLAEWMAWVPTLPAETTTIARLETTPVLVVAGVHLGTRDETRQLLAPLYSGAPTIQRSATARSYADAMLLEASCLHNTSAQCAPAPLTGVSPILGPRQPFVATSHYFEHPLPASAINAAIDAMNNHLTIVGSGTGTIQFDSYGGAVGEIAPTATAFAHRNAFCSAQYASLWTTPGSTDPHRALVARHPSDVEPVVGWRRLRELRRPRAARLGPRVLGQQPAAAPEGQAEVGPAEPLLVPAERPAALTGTRTHVATKIRINRDPEYCDLVSRR